MKCVAAIYKRVRMVYTLWIGVKRRCSSHHPLLTAGSIPIYITQWQLLLQTGR